MRSLYNNSRPDGTENIGDSDKFTGESAERSAENPKELIRAANHKVSLIKILNQYGIKPNRARGGNWSQMVQCPLKSHKGGKERTPSFGYNFQQDRFNCLGCGVSGMAVEFLSISEGKWDGDRFIPKSKLLIAKRILEKYSGYTTDESRIEETEDPRTEKVLFEFSGYVQKTMRASPDKPDVLGRIDKVLFWIDSYLKDKAPKGKVTFEGLEKRIIRAKEVIDGLEISNLG
jgi:hypothetical protein